MSRPPRAVFVERRTYRRRRLSDAARLLPVLGALLFLVPVLWNSDSEDSGSTASGGIYIFLVWGALILIAYFLSRHLVRSDPDETPSERSE